MKGRLQGCRRMVVRFRIVWAGQRLEVAQRQLETAFLHRTLSLKEHTARRSAAVRTFERRAQRIISYARRHRLMSDGGFAAMLIHLPVYRCAWASNRTYGRHDVVMVEGALWEAQQPTTSRPGSDASWLLIIPRSS